VIVDAIRLINPDAVFIVGNNSIDEITWLDGTKPIEKSVIESKIKELEKEYADNEYQRKRLVEYNAIGIGEQLDMIYHDMDAWKAKIKSIKDKFQKP